MKSLVIQGTVSCQIGKTIDPYSTDGPRMATRNKLWHPEIVRQRIKISQLLNRLEDQALNGTELAPGQQRAIEILLRKCMPDLTSVALSGSVEMTKPDELSDATLAHLATAGRDRTAEPSPEPPEPSEVH